MYYDDFVSSGSTETRRDGLFALQGPLSTLQLKVDPLDGDVALMNPTESPISLDSYRIVSDTSLNSAQWSPISNQSISGFPAGNGTGNGWEIGPNVGPGELVEWYLLGDSTLAAGDSIYLGKAYNSAVDGHDLQFSYSSDDTNVLGSVLYEPFVPNVGAVAGDYNGNGVVDAADYTVWRRSPRSNVSVDKRRSRPVARHGHARGLQFLEDPLRRNRRAAAPWRTHGGSGAVGHLAVAVAPPRQFAAAAGAVCAVNLPIADRSFAAAIYSCTNRSKDADARTFLSGIAASDSVFP